MHLHLRVEWLAHQRPGQRRVDANQALAQVQFVRPDNAIAGLLAVFVFDGNPGAEIYLARIAWLVTDDLELLLARELRLAQRALALRAEVGEVELEVEVEIKIYGSSFMSIRMNIRSNVFLLKSNE